ncbi:hypothetical protein RB195_012549 [Necator americanus]|uniref:RING-type domain-containing protein n=1 Tax=Necator americanus TaxID=51031 RepID=A0ABR1DRE1_NECAM
MTSFIHCMICFAFPAPDLKFFLSGCGHVACFRCVQKGSMTIKCKVCLKDNPQILEINRNLKPQLLELFTSFTDGFSRVVRDIGHISDFQNGHRQRLMRHFHIKSRNFEKLQTFCQEEIKKKNQYKQELHRLRVEYKRKCDETAELRAKITKLKNCTLDLNDMTHDPFRTPVSTKASDQRSFMTSTPFKYPRKYDITESTMSATRPTDTTVSFTALGEPTVSIDPGEEVWDHLMDAVSLYSYHRDDPSSGIVTCLNSKNPFVSGTPAERKESDVQIPVKAPVTKKTRLDMMSKTQPLPLKSLN